MQTVTNPEFRKPADQTKRLVEISLSFPIVNVDGGVVTIEVPVYNARTLDPAAADMLTKGMTEREADQYLDDVAHYAFTQSLRRRIQIK